MRKPLILNLGCGKEKILGAINIDIEKSVKPDKIVDFINGKLPYKKGTVDEVYLFHTIEHIRKRDHLKVYAEIYNVLKTNGVLYLAYPEFTECYKRWSKNYLGRKNFWEHCIFGRQLYPSDYHVCIMHTSDVIRELGGIGFGTVTYKPDTPHTEAHNTIVRAVKNGIPNVEYEEIVKQHTEMVKVK